ncbi:50S ribosomal protein L35 [Ruegeria marina]|uniref:Large ribosomal subunit protein bL35 n=1 Tax=Ruegeria marina TaxID=639004 RepID=A0A1G6I676_9RHOB|nr:50S ribosomal protein L35 [Ruegeria marina]SDC02004.1 large subunit ribosomal protein L35 [Ruegeria marina]
MPKLKSKSSAKKRFKFTRTGKVLRAQAGKRHGMIKRTKKQIRDKRGMVVMDEADAQTVRKHYLPYGN